MPFPNEPSSTRRCPRREKNRWGSEKGLAVERGETEFLLMFAGAVTLGTLSVSLEDLILSQKTLWSLLDKGMRRRKSQVERGNTQTTPDGFDFHFLKRESRDFEPPQGHTDS